jgi:hypothetical protein
MPALPRLSREARAKKKAQADRNHERYVIKTYGLTEGEYARRLEEQDGRCAICTRIPRNRRLAVDHDHETGRVRALICYRCNLYLGHWEFDPVAAHNAAVYLAAIAAGYGAGYDPLSKRLVEPDTAAPRPLSLPRVTRVAT